MSLQAVMKGDPWAYSVSSLGLLIQMDSQSSSLEHEYRNPSSITTSFTCALQVGHAIESHVSSRYINGPSHRSSPLS